MMPPQKNTHTFEKIHMLTLPQGQSATMFWTEFVACNLTSKCAKHTQGQKQQQNKFLDE